MEKNMKMWLLRHLAKHLRGTAGINAPKPFPGSALKDFYGLCPINKALFLSFSPSYLSLAIETQYMYNSCFCFMKPTGSWKEHWPAIQIFVLPLPSRVAGQVALIVLSPILHLPGALAQDFPPSISSHLHFEKEMVPPSCYLSSQGLRATKGYTQGPGRHMYESQTQGNSNLCSSWVSLCLSEFISETQGLEQLLFQLFHLIIW